MYVQPVLVTGVPWRVHTCKCVGAKGEQGGAPSSFSVLLYALAISLFHHFREASEARRVNCGSSASELYRQTDCAPHVQVRVFVFVCAPLHDTHTLLLVGVLRLHRGRERVLSR